jgi:hypothetical protein
VSDELDRCPGSHGPRAPTAAPKEECDHMLIDLLVGVAMPVEDGGQIRVATGDG